LDAKPPWEHKGRGRIARTWRLVKQLRPERLDLLILLRSSLSAGLLARLSGAKITLGYTRRGFGWLLTDPIARDFSASPPTSAVDDYLNLIETLGFTAASRQLELATTPANEAAADRIRK